MERAPIELEAGWEQMRTGIAKLVRILEKETEEQFNSQEYMSLYTTIFNMCTQKHPHEFSEQIYTRYRQAFDQYISSRVLPHLEAAGVGEGLLRETLLRWSNHRIMVRWLARFCAYLDRFYIHRHQLPNLQDVGLLAFKDTVYATNKGRVKDALLTLVEREREAENVDRDLIRGVLSIYIDVGMNAMTAYEKDWEVHLLTGTHEYYERKAALWVQEDSCPDYLQKAEDCLLAEEDRADSYLHASTKKKLLEAAQEELLAKNEVQVIEKDTGCAAMLRDDKRDDLARLSRVFSRIPSGLHPIALLFRRHLEEEGMALVNEVTAAAAQTKPDGTSGRKEAVTAQQAFVRKVLALQDKYLDVVDTCFGAHSLLHKALKEAFETFCNKSVAGTTTAELMANYCDMLLRKGGVEKLSDEDIDKTLEKVVKMLSYISDKDLFAEFYRKRLAKRLLGASSMDDHETTFLQRLKQQRGAQFTQKMEGMVNDLRIARSKQTEFKAWTERKGMKLPIETDVKVLTTGFWPSYKTTELALPVHMATCVTAFGQFYEETTAHRNLNWIHALGNTAVKAQFVKKRHELLVQPYQAALLMLFNDVDELSHGTIMEQLKLPEEEVSRTLESFACGKYRVLHRKGASPTAKPKAISKDDVFVVNAAFSASLVRIKLPMPQVDEKRKVVEDVDKERQYAIDAAIVRIMKSRKALEHQALMLEVMQQVKKMFNPESKAVKKRLEDLINRDFLERDKDNANLYKYIA